MPFIDWEASQKTQSRRTRRRDPDNRIHYIEDEKDPARHGSYSQQYSLDNPSRPHETEPEPDNFGENGSYQKRYSQMNGRQTGQEDPQTVISGSSRTTDSAYQDLWKKLLRKRQGILEQDLPRLGEKTEKQLASNFRQLSLIEGNLVNGQDAVKTIYISSCFHGEGRTTASISTAYGLAVYRGRKVLLVDTNHQSPQIHRFFQAGNTPGLQDVLASASAPLEAILPTVYQNLYLLPADDEKQLLFSQEFIRTLTGLWKNFDYVVIDGQPILASSDFSHFAQNIDTVLLVIACEKTKWEVVQMAEEKINKAGAKVCGAILNKRKFYIPKWVYQKVSR